MISLDNCKSQQLELWRTPLYALTPDLTSKHLIATSNLRRGTILTSAGIAHGAFALTNIVSIEPAAHSNRFLVNSETTEISEIGEPALKTTLHNLKARDFIDQKKYDQAVIEGRKGIAEDSVPAYVPLCEALNKSGRYSEALRLCNKGLAKIAEKEKEEEGSSTEDENSEPESTKDSDSDSAATASEASTESDKLTEKIDKQDSTEGMTANQTSEADQEATTPQSKEDAEFDEMTKRAANEPGTWDKVDLLTQRCIANYHLNKRSTIAADREQALSLLERTKYDHFKRRSFDFKSTFDFDREEDRPNPSELKEQTLKAQPYLKMLADSDHKIFNERVARVKLETDFSATSHKSETKKRSGSR